MRHYLVGTVEFIFFGKATEFGDNRHKRLEQLPMFLEPKLRDSLPRCGSPTTVAVGEELLLERLIFEDIEDAK